jgi:hypothetical protein
MIPLDFMQNSDLPVIACPFLTSFFYYFFFKLSNLF